MKTNTRTSLGIIATVVIYAISVMIPRFVKLPFEAIPPSFLTHTFMLLLSGILIRYFHSKQLIHFRVSGINPKVLFRIIATSVVAFIAVNVLSVIVFKILHISIQEKANPFLNFTLFQYFTFVLIYASIAEECLFRGFLLNMLAPLRNKGIRLSKMELTAPVLISGVLFGLAHFILLTSTASIPFVFRIVFLTTTIGIIAGYFQEKYENNTLVAIVIHMTVNALGMIGLLIATAK
ncbi:MAG: CPBP family intramembrane glutamic endopeptidase [Bacteroidota bacterium]